MLPLNRIMSSVEDNYRIDWTSFTPPHIALSQEPHSVWSCDQRFFTHFRASLAYCYRHRHHHHREFSACHRHLWGSESHFATYKWCSRKWRRTRTSLWDIRRQASRKRSKCFVSSRLTWDVKLVLPNPICACWTAAWGGLWVVGDFNSMIFCNITITQMFQ